MTQEGSPPHRKSSDPASDATLIAGTGARSAPRSTAGLRFTPGERLADRYRLQALLGRGGMGEVYAADDEELGIPVALKVLHIAIGPPGEGLWRLKREVLLARSVAHPHVCRVYDLGRHMGGVGGVGGETPVWFLTMELLSGETLRERLAHATRLPVSDALAITEHMAAGLGSAHRAGVVHRDFKSSNVMLVTTAGSERAVVTDFGLAREAGGPDRRDEAAGWVGTPAYMAPEQVRGEEAGPAADIYALGVVLFEMTTGRLPFVAPTAAETARMRLTAPPPSPRAVGAAIDERWEAVILRCLAPEPARRFARAEEVAEALAERRPVVLDEASATALHPPLKLPAEQDAFVGRDLELAELGRKIADGSRLVTLMGPAGMGKTRLALRYGWQSRDTWPGGIWFADLTEARNATDLASAVARSLGLALGKAPPIEQLGHAIAARGRCLVILDNFEQLAAHAPETIGAWLDRAAEASFIVTSRERLNLRAEDTLLIEPLAIEAGLALFAERARRQRPDFVLDAAVKPAVTEIVRWAEGMPLAIELVAARVRVMTVEQLAARLRDRFRLAGGSGHGRHATLRAAMDGSWELLRPEERSALAQCAVFEGGFTLEAVENVVDLSDWDDAPWVVDVVQSLVDKSLVRARVPVITQSAEAPEVRFGMYASVQEYAGEKLDSEIGAPAMAAAHARHGQWYARYGSDDWVESIERIAGGEQRRVLRSELENLVAACRRAVARGDGATAAATFRAIWAVVDLRGPYALAVDLGLEVLKAPLGALERGLVLSSLGTAEWRMGRMEEARGHLETALAIHRERGERRQEGEDLRSLGRLHSFQGRVDEARAHYEAALTVLRAIGDRNAEGVVLSNLAALHQGTGNTDESLAVGLEALALNRETGNRRAEAVTLSNLASMELVKGRVQEALDRYEAALAVQREVGDRAGESIVLGNLGILHLTQGRMAAARSHCESSLAILREVGDRRLEGAILGDLGHLHEEEGRSDEAHACYQAALAIQREVSDRRHEGILMGSLGELYRRQGQLDEARQHLEAGIAIVHEAGDRRFEGGLLGSLASVDAAQGRIDDAEAAIERGEALIRESGDRLGLAYFLCRRAEVEHLRGRAAAGLATLDEAATLATKLGSGPDTDLSRLIAKLRQRLQSDP
jgi:predicted ATPase/tetratricopeptide (TPR) repeat protein